MKKLLPLLLPFFLQANAHESDHYHIHVSGAKIENIETFVGLTPNDYRTYIHPETKKVGELMPIPFGENLYDLDVTSSYKSYKEGEDARPITCHKKDRNKKTIGTVKSSGPINDYGKDGDKTIGVKIFGKLSGSGYDLNGDGNPEYEVLRKVCGSKENRWFETHVVFDVHHELFYIDSSRDKQIDSILKGDEIKKIVSLRIPTCEQEKPLMSSEFVEK